MSVRRKINELLDELRILTPKAVGARWRIIYVMLTLLIEKVRIGMEYRDAYLRPWEITAKVKQPTSVSNVIHMLVKFTPKILKPQDLTLRRPSEVQFTKEGVLKLKRETEIWNEIFKLTDEYDFLKPLVQVLTQRFDEIYRYMQGSLVEQTKSN